MKINFSNLILISFVLCAIYFAKEKITSQKKLIEQELVFENLPKTPEEEEENIQQIAQYLADNPNALGPKDTENFQQIDEQQEIQKSSPSLDPQEKSNQLLSNLNEAAKNTDEPGQILDALKPTIDFFWQIQEDNTQIQIKLLDGIFRIQNIHQTPEFKNFILEVVEKFYSSENPDQKKLGINAFNTYQYIETDRELLVEFQQDYLTNENEVAENEALPHDSENSEVESNDQQEEEVVVESEE